jgi:hypothetical protein
MSDNATYPVPQTFPTVTCPTVFADGVLNVSIAPGIVKHYLFRFEPSFKGNNEFETQPIAQVVMPTEGFITTVLYFNTQIERLIKANFIKPERVAELRKLFEEGAQ